MVNIWDTVIKGLSDLDTLIGVPETLKTIFNHFRNNTETHTQQILDIIRKKSKIAYKLYCEFSRYRDDLGIPVEKNVLDYWESCLERSILPSVKDMVISKIASKEEADILLPYLIEQWMTVPEFSTWLHDILNQNHLEEITEKLTDLPQISRAISPIKAQLEAEEINNIATLISSAKVNDAKCSCSNSDIKYFFTVDNNFYTMLHVISADEDIPHKEALQTVMELIQKGSPVIITGNGGQGKTSLMMRAAVQWVSSGHLAVWLSLSNKNTITEQSADKFFDCLIKFTPTGQRILLCIDNPFEGKGSLLNLQTRWFHNTKIQLLMAERENRLTLLADKDQDLLFHWFDNTNLIVLQGINQTKEYHLKNYSSYFFQENTERRKKILGKCISCLAEECATNGDEQLPDMRKILSKYEKPNVSLVELIYRTLFELKKVTGKLKNIKLDWKEWGELINREFNNVDSDIQLYGVIAAFKIFNTPLSLSLFCKYFNLNERKLENRLRERFVPYHIEPVVYQESSKTLEPKHDVIAELFFLFNKDKVTIDSLMLGLIEVMDKNEIEMLLETLLTHIKESRKFPVGEINYWTYIEKIYARMQEGSCNLTQEGRIYLCLGFLWTTWLKKPFRDSSTIQTILESIAPKIENNLLIATLYTEWGLWATRKKNNSLAEKNFRTVIAYNPELLPARIALGHLLSKQKGREIETEKVLREIINIDSKNLQSYTELGRLLAKQKGREIEVEYILREARNIDPTHFQSCIELGRLLAKQLGREIEAERILREARNIDPKNLQSYTELGRLLAKQPGREIEAEHVLREALNIDPRHLQSRTELGRLLAKQPGREIEAEQILREALNIDPRHLQSRTELGHLLAKQRREAEAEHVLRKALNIDFKNFQSCIELGRLLAKQSGREIEAESILREALNIDPKNLQSYTELGQLLAKQPGREIEAEHVLREALNIDPDNQFGKDGLSRLE